MTLVRCQACERRAASRTEPTDLESEPFLPCPSCQRRLVARALRPLEGFNLARRHGWQQSLLHDDVYDEDGAASQAEDEVEVEVEGADALLAPTLEAACAGLESLLDFALRRAVQTRPAPRARQRVEALLGRLPALLRQDGAA